MSERSLSRFVPLGAALSEREQKGRIDATGISSFGSTRIRSWGAREGWGTNHLARGLGYSVPSIGSTRIRSSVATEVRSGGGGGEVVLSWAYMTVGDGGGTERDRARPL